MTKIMIDDLLRVLRFAPAGLTTVEVAEKLNLTNLNTLGGRLSKLADYGRIDRRFERPDVRTRRCRWHSKDVIVVGVVDA